MTPPPPIPFIPDTAPFTPEQRAWLNGFLAGLLAAVPPGPAPAPLLNPAPGTPREPLLFLFGSQTGTAENLARRLARESQERGFAPRVLALDDYAQADLLAATRLVIVSSTWGDGDPPDNAATFWSWLNSDTAPRLEHLQFAVLGLGDKTYADFCGASKKFDARLEALGAARLIPRGECDVDYEAPAMNWANGLWNQLANHGDRVSAMPPPATNGALNGNHQASRWAFPAEISRPQTRPAEASVAARPRHDKSNPFPATLLKNVLLNQPGSAKEVRHFEFSLAGSDLAYEVGDALGVLPANCPALVNDLLVALDSSGDEPVQIGERTASLREALTRHFDIARPTAELIAAIAQRAPASDLATLLVPGHADDLKKWLWGRDVLDVLTLLASPMPVADFVAVLRKMSPRLYSISSSPRAHSAEVHLTVSAVRYEHLGRRRKGVASTYLADRVGEADRVRMFVQPSPGFKLPADASAPVIMVGPGTGIAPFRAFLQERQTTGAPGKNWLFFGDQRRATDFLYEDQLTAWHESGHLSRLDLAFSRDQAQKLYVQDRMREQSAELWSWLEAGAYFYVCGDASRMAKDVDQALHQTIQTEGGKSSDQATAYIARLKTEKRYQRDVY